MQDEFPASLHLLLEGQHATMFKPGCIHVFSACCVSTRLILHVFMLKLYTQYEFDNIAWRHKLKLLDGNLSLRVSGSFFHYLAGPSYVTSRNPRRSSFFITSGKKEEPYWSTEVP